MYKVTQLINVYLLLLVLPACNENMPQQPQLPEQRADAAISARIDSAYAAISLYCDSMMNTQVPVWADSLVQGDSSALVKLKDTGRYRCRREISKSDQATHSRL